MVTAYSQMGDISTAHALFNKMLERNIVNSLLAAYIQHGHAEEGLKMYIRILREAYVKSNWITFRSLLSAWAESAALRLGNQIVSQSIKSGFDYDVSVANGITTMYSKCGRIEEAQEIFNLIPVKDLVSWNAMITGYAQNGLERKAIQIFEGMLKTGTEPDYVTYIVVLSGCGHSVLKLMSLVTARELIVRDATRFHHIKNGACSCGDYW
ncbi:hypothetical protein AAC387_Pa04g2095 [Persea americana]